MAALEVVRWFDLGAISLAVGFMIAVGFRVWSDVRIKVPWYLHLLGVSYVLFAITAAAEVQLAQAEQLPATWRTAVATVAALFGVVASGAAYFFWSFHNVSDDV